MTIHRFVVALLFASVAATPLLADEPALPDPALLDKAVRTAVHNGIATLVARQRAEGNHTDFVVPTLLRRKVVNVTYTEVKRHYTRTTVEVPVYEYEYAERTVAVRDSSGKIVGYRKQKYRVARKQVGTKQVERLVPDPDGEVERTHRIPKREYGPGDDLIRRGFYAANGMALYVFDRAGLGDHEAAHLLRNSLYATLNQTSLPDGTADLAWLCLGFSGAQADHHREMAQRLASRLIDGASRERGPTQGLWGPVSIHYELFSQLVVAQVKVTNAATEARRKYEALPDRQKPRALPQVEKLEALAGKVAAALNEVTQAGQKLNQVTGAVTLSDSLRAEGLPYHAFNRVLVDTDSTALALRALAEAKRAGVLPAMSRRPDLGRQLRLARPENALAVVRGAATKVAAATWPAGGFHEINGRVVNTALDRMPTGLVSGVPYEGEMATLPYTQTVRSDVSGLAAVGYAGAMDAAAAAKSKALRAAGADRVAGWVDRLLAADDWDRSLPLERETGAALAGDLAERRSFAVAHDGRDVAWDYGGAPYAALVHLAPLLAAEPPEPLEGLYDRLAYRLLLEQDAYGEWHTAGRSAGLVSSSQVLEGLLGRKGRNALRDEKAGRAMLDQLFRRPPGRAQADPDEVYPTLAALVYLVELLDEPIELDESLILPSGPAEPDEPVEGGKLPKLMTPAQAVRQVKRPNPHLDALRGAGG